MITTRIIGADECAQRRRDVPIRALARAPHPQDRIDRLAALANRCALVAAGVVGVALLGGFS